MEHKCESSPAQIKIACAGFKLCAPLALLGTSAVVLAICTSLGWEEVASFLFDRVEGNDHKVEQVLMLNSVLILLVVTCLPGPALMLMFNGFFFGFWCGLAVGFPAEITACLLARLLSQACRRDMRAWMMSIDRTREFIQVCEEDSSLIFLVLFRFIGLPIGLKNYGLATLDITFLRFFLICLPSELFYTSLFTHVGSTGYSIGNLVRQRRAGEVLSGSVGMQLGLLGLSVATLVLLCTLAWCQYRKRVRILRPDDAPALEGYGACARPVAL